MKNLKEIIQLHGINKLGFLKSQVHSEQWWEKHDLKEIFKELSKFPDFTKALYDRLEMEKKYCVMCGKESLFINFSKGYRDICSKSCSMKRGSSSEISKAKVRSTKLDRYGSETYNNSHKAVKTSRENGSYETRQIKIKETNLEKYGVESTNSLDSVKRKKEDTYIKIYGEKNPFMSEVFQEKSKKTKLKKYGNENFVNPEKGINTKYERYGTDHFSVTMENNMKKLTSGENYSHISQSHITNFQELENLTVDSIQKWVKGGRFLFSDFMGYFNISQTHASNLKRELIPNIPSKSNKHKTQQEIFDYLDSNSKIMNERSLIKPLEIDILLDSFGIEYNGLMYHSFGKSKYTRFNNHEFEEKYSHLRKTELVEEKGLSLFHIFEDEWMETTKRNIWKSMLDGKLFKHKRLYARNCEVKSLSNKEVKGFCERNHLQGHINAKIKLGLYHQGELVTVMTFGSSRMNKNIQWEIYRMCSKINITVVGGASKLLKYFERNYNPESLLSYANRRWSQGNVYEKLGFEFSHNTDPNFYWFHPKEKVLYSRQKFQKHKLKDLLEYFDITKSAKINMFNNGYRIIYDSGNKVYKKDYNEETV